MTELRERFRAHYDREISFLYNLLRRMGVATADIEDVAHEVFTRVFQKLETYDESRPFRPWLTAFAVPAAIDYRRKHRARSVDVPLELAQPAESLSDRREAHDLVMHGLDAMDDDRRQVLVLHDLYGHSMPEVAAILGIQPATGYARLRSARARFAAEILRRKDEVER